MMPLRVPCLWTWERLNRYAFRGRIPSKFGNCDHMCGALEFHFAESHLPLVILMGPVLMVVLQHENWFHLGFHLGIQKFVSIDGFFL